MSKLQSTFLSVMTLIFSVPVLADEMLVEKGRAVYELWCTPCHAPGNQHPGTNALAAKYQGEIPAVLEQRSGLTLEFVSQFVRNGVSIMPFFRKTEISDKDLEAIAAYLTQSKN